MSLMAPFHDYRFRVTGLQVMVKLSDKLLLHEAYRCRWVAPTRGIPIRAMAYLKSLKKIANTDLKSWRYHSICNNLLTTYYSNNFFDDKFCHFVKVLHHL